MNSLFTLCSVTVIETLGGAITAEGVELSGAGPSLVGRKVVMTGLVLRQMNRIPSPIGLLPKARS